MEALFPITARQVMFFFRNADTLPQFFDPVAYRIILFDQRGSGKSTPYVCLSCFQRLTCVGMRAWKKILPGI